MKVFIQLVVMAIDISKNNLIIKTWNLQIMFIINNVFDSAF